MSTDQSTNIDKIEDLIKEFHQNREQLKEMILDIEKVKEKIELLLPDSSLDKRYTYLFEQRVKAAFSIFSTLLNIRSEISKSIKDEFELRRKYQKEIIDILDEDDDEDAFDNISDEAERKLELIKNKVCDM